MPVPGTLRHFSQLSGITVTRTLGHLLKGSGYYTTPSLSDILHIKNPEDLVACDPTELLYM